jgi:hypothetical protein
MAERKVTPRKIKGLNQDGSPNASWRKFKIRLDNYTDTPEDEWDEYYFLGHILKRYKDYMGTEFPLSYKSAPSKSQELYCVKRMIATLSVQDKQTIKNYIDFVYDTYILPKKVAVTSLAYFFTVNFIFDFKSKYRKDTKITRNTQLPPNCKEVINNLSLDVCTYGDLAFAKLALDNDPKNDALEVYSKMFEELKNTGFDTGVLERLDGN